MSILSPFKKPNIRRHIHEIDLHLTDASQTVLFDITFKEQAVKTLFKELKGTHYWEKPKHKKAKGTHNGK
jgi:hypothetical protein